MRLMTQYAEIVGFLDIQIIHDLVAAEDAVKTGDDRIEFAACAALEECRAMALGALPGEIGA